MAWLEVRAVPTCGMDGCVEFRLAHIRSMVDLVREVMRAKGVSNLLRRFIRRSMCVCVCVWISVVAVERSLDVLAPRE